MKTAIAIIVVGITAMSLLMLSSSSVSTDAESQFQNFLNTYKKGYTNDYEFDYRLSVFKSNLKTIEELNKANPMATFGVNEFADRTPEEMKSLMKFINLNEGAPVKAPSNSTPRDIDWSGYMGDAKDQGQCGSCWAFSAAGAAEGRYALATNQTKVTTRFSEQQLVDCDEYSSGCMGGWMFYAFNYWLEHDICLESDYKYNATRGECKECSTGIRLAGYQNLTANGTAILNDLWAGPVSVAVDASTWSFYTGGVLSSCDKNLNHGVTLVGYNSTESTITIRNSWGAFWGERGHIRLNSTGSDCGWTYVASSPVFKSVNTTLAFE